MGTSPCFVVVHLHWRKVDLPASLKCESSLTNQLAHGQRLEPSPRGIKQTWSDVGWTKRPHQTKVKWLWNDILHSLKLTEQPWKLTNLPHLRNPHRLSIPPDSFWAIVQGGSFGDLMDFHPRMFTRDGVIRCTGVLNISKYQTFSLPSKEKQEFFFPEPWRETFEKPISPYDLRQVIHLSSSWWLNHPSEKQMVKMGIFPNFRTKITNIRKHHPVMYISWSSQTPLGYLQIICEHQTHPVEYVLQVTWATGSVERRYHEAWPYRDWLPPPATPTRARLANRV